MAVPFASRLSLIAFATASLRGVMLGAEFQATLKTALIAAAVFYGIGLIAGELARRLVEENVELEFANWQAEHAESNSQKPSNST